MTKRTPDRPLALVALIVVQILCATFFAWDVVEDIRTAPPGTLATAYMSIEALATLSLVLAVVFEIRYLQSLLLRKAHLENQVSVASGAFQEILLAHFDDWGLTNAERDVAAFAIKGMSTAEIAGLRGAAEGTVKSQLNAIYRKAGVPNRGALLGLLVDELVSAPLLGNDSPPQNG